MTSAKRSTIYGLSLLLALIIVTVSAIVVFLVDIFEGFTTMALFLNILLLSEVIHG